MSPRRGGRPGAGSRGDRVAARRRWPECVGCGERHSPGEPCPNGTTWSASRVVCRVCGSVHIAVWPSSAEPGELECPECGSMACEPDDWTA